MRDPVLYNACLIPYSVGAARGNVSESHHVFEVLLEVRIIYSGFLSAENHDRHLVDQAIPGISEMACTRVTKHLECVLM